jgi:hypothetical protein
MYSPQGINAAGTTVGTKTVFNLWGKYASACPNLSAGTHMLCNGVPYPQQTYDPLNRPQEVFCDLLQSLQTWSNDAVKPSLAFRNWAVCDSLADVTPNSFATAVGKMGTQGGPGLWRVMDTTSFRTLGCKEGLAKSIIAGDATIIPPYLGMLKFAAAKTVATYFTVAVAATSNAVIEPNTCVAMTDKTAPVGNGSTDITANPSDTFAPLFFEGTSSSENSETAPSHNVQSGGFHGPLHLQHIQVFDFEHLAKEEYLSGTSSLTGAFFFKMNIAQALRFGTMIYFIACYDQITILDTALRTAQIKI